MQWEGAHDDHGARTVPALRYYCPPSLPSLYMQETLAVSHAWRRRPAAPSPAAGGPCHPWATSGPLQDPPGERKYTGVGQGPLQGSFGVCLKVDLQFF